MSDLSDAKIAEALCIIARSHKKPVSRSVGTQIDAIKLASLCGEEKIKVEIGVGSVSDHSRFGMYGSEEYLLWFNDSYDAARFDKLRSIKAAEGKIKMVKNPFADREA